MLCGLHCILEAQVIWRDRHHDGQADVAEGYRLKSTMAAVAIHTCVKVSLNANGADDAWVEINKAFVFISQFTSRVVFLDMGSHKTKCRKSFIFLPSKQLQPPNIIESTQRASCKHKQVEMSSS